MIIYLKKLTRDINFLGYENSRGVEQYREAKWFIS